MRACRESMPAARVMASRSLDDALDFARDLQDEPPSLLVSAGGDGSAVALINAMRTSSKGHGSDVLLEGPAFGLLPLGTGNGWANVTGAPAWRKAVTRLGHLAERGGPLPLRRFDLVEVRGGTAGTMGAPLGAAPSSAPNPRETRARIPRPSSRPSPAPAGTPRSSTTSTRRSRASACSPAAPATASAATCRASSRAPSPATSPSPRSRSRSSTPAKTP